jgi:hypothetical protein
MSITSVVNDLVTSVSVINALKPLPPTISGYSVGGLDDTALDPAGGQTVQINGTGFLAGATITFDGSAVAVVTYVSPNQLTFTSPAKSAGTYTIYAVNPDGGTAIFIPGIIYSVLPTWTTSAGSLGSYYETTSISNTVVASGDAPITYSLFSGSLPTGATLYANGVITGTAPVDSSSTTYSFTIQATDAQLQDSTRSFSLTINVDAVTWVSPANNTTYTNAVDSAIANVTLSATDAAGYAVSYSANALPTGLSLTGANISGTPTVIADSSTLLTATAATTNRSAVRTINWSITVANDPYFEYNTLLIPGASTTFVDDASTNNFAVTINGDTRPNSFNPYTPGYYSGYFDGTGDYLSAPSNAAFAVGTIFTMECWFYPSSQVGALMMGTVGTAAPQLGWQNTTTFGLASVSTAWRLTSGTLPTLNSWNHVAVVRSGTSTNQTSVFLNGVRIANGTVTDAWTTTTGFTIGGASDGTTNFTGYISNSRLVKGTAVYDPSLSTITVPTTPLTAISNTSLLTCQSNRFIDNSTNNFTITVTGNTLISSFDPFVPNSSYSTYGSGYFDGTGDYLSSPSNSAFDLGSVDFTIECWFNSTSFASEQGQALVSRYNYVGASGYGWLIVIPNSTAINFVVGNDIVNSISVSSLSTNTWYHVAVSRSSTTTKMFLNGIQIGSFSTSNFADAGTALQIGRTNTVTNDFSGYITDVRVVKGTAVYTSAFTPPATPLTAIANTSLLTLQNNQSVNNNTFLDNSTNNLLVTRNGNTTQGTFSPYGGNWSNYFDGNGDYLSIANNSAFNQNTAFTVECWVNSSAGGYFFTQLNSGYLGLNYTADTRKIQVDKSFVGVQITSTNSFSFNQWYHVAMSYDGTTTRLFVNGALEGSVAGGGSASNTDTRIGNYNTGSNFYTGYISNFRVSNTGLYTSAFTPSTTPLIPTANTKFLTCADNRLIDDSINNLTITKGGDVSVQRFSPFNPSIVTPTSYSGYFDGTGDYLTLPDSNLWAVSGDFTIEAWVYPTSLPNESCIFAVWEGGTIANTSLNFNIQTNGRLSFIGAVSNTQYTVTGTTTTIIVNTWSHVAVVRSGTTVSLYVNGVADASTVTMAGTVNNLSPGPSIGSLNNGGAGFTSPLNGTISNLRLVTSAVYTANFTPSTTPLTAIANTILLTCQSSTFIDNSTNNFTISAFGNSQPTQQNPFGFTSATTNGYTVSTIGGSAYFDGTGDSLGFSSSYLPTVAGTAFTLEFWIYSTRAIGTATNVISSGNMELNIDSTNPGQIRFDLPAGITNVLTSGSIRVQPNTWNHIVLTRTTGNAYTLYLNGINVGTGSSGTAITALTTFGTGTNPVLGFITDLRTTRALVYTSNFVPPSAPLTAVQNTTLLTNMTSAGVYDAAMMNNMETVGTAVLDTSINKFSGSNSMSFPSASSNGAYMKFKTPQPFLFGTGAFTVEMWVRETVVGSYALYISDWSSSTGRSSWGFGRTSALFSSSELNFFAGTTYTSLRTPWTPTANVWYHVAVCRSGSSLRFFVDGTQLGTTFTYADAIDNTYGSGSFYINNSNNAGGWGMQGYINNLRVTSGYARYTSNFTPPTSAFPIY